MSSLLAASSDGGGFQGPGPKDFDLPGIFSSVSWFTKPILVALLMTVVIAVFYWLSARKAAVVPSRLQFAGESIYGFIRNDVALDAIGHEGLRFTPYLATLFSFIALNNLAGIIPFLQFPTMSHIAFPLVLAVFSWIVFLSVGIRRKGFGGYFKGVLFPPGVPWPVYILLTPLEFFSTIIVRPVTLMLRLTFNMFAGHLVLLLFILGGEYLLLHYSGGGSPIGVIAGSVSLLGSIVLTFFEAFVQLIQAYVFTLLTALYIGGALADEH